MFSDKELSETSCIHCGYVDCDGTCRQPRCSECGLKGDFAGYHNVGRDGKTLCVACAEKEIEVYKITEAVPGNGFFLRDIKEAIENIRTVEDADPGDGYTITKETMSLLNYEAMEEFQGF